MLDERSLDGGQLPAGGGKFYADSYQEIGGGVAANAAVAVARLGGSARYIGLVGDDALGDRILAGLDLLQQEREQEEKLSGRAPEILVRNEPTVLVQIDGDPILEPIDGTDVMAVVNTPFTNAKPLPT